MQMKSTRITLTTVLLLAAVPATAQFHPSKESLEGVYPPPTYSPYAQRDIPLNVYWGDTHLHTGLSPDAGLFGNTTGLDEAYRFARGEEVRSASGLPAKLRRPLDWLVLTEHSDMMGFATDMLRGAANILATDKGREWYDGLSAGGTEAADAAVNLINTFSQGKLPPKLVADYSPGSKVYASVWDSIIDAAERYNEPGRFTAFIGYEWTSVPQGNNMHRNIVFRDNSDRARQVVPMVTIPPIGSTDVLDLYKWLAAYEQKTGGSIFTLAHNGNISNGWMFPTKRTYAGGRVDKNYVEQRARWEPLYEITQIKGDGETHPYLSPDDEFADYETWDAGNLDLSTAKTPDMLSREYAREALKQGLGLEAKLGTNPYKFGFSGATDAHTSLSAVEEENYFGKSTAAEPSPTRMEHPFTKTENGVFEGYSLVASGYTGVWAKENTRHALWDAMERRETYGTTGPRITVRFFGGWNYVDDDLMSRQPAVKGYEKGVPMGADLPAAESADAPTFMVYALRDPIGANLDRVQIVKGWRDEDGDLHEKVYDVAWSDDRVQNADGKLPPVGNTVDLGKANWLNTIGASELGSVWTDPDFDAEESAFYYARVLEIPTPRWVVYDALRFGVEIPEGAEKIGQERAYTSPIWYTP